MHPLSLHEIAWPVSELNWRVSTAAQCGVRLSWRPISVWNATVPLGKLTQRHSGLIGRGNGHFLLQSSSSVSSG
jgi:hypothetical protein